MGVKMNLRILTKNHEADPEIGFLAKSISKPYGHVTAMPPAWELNTCFILLLLLFYLRQRQFDYGFWDSFLWTAQKIQSKFFLGFAKIFHLPVVDCIYYILKYGIKNDFSSNFRNT